MTKECPTSKLNKWDWDKKLIFYIQHLFYIFFIPCAGPKVGGGAGRGVERPPLFEKIFLFPIGLGGRPPLRPPFFFDPAIETTPPPSSPYSKVYLRPCCVEHCTFKGWACMCKTLSRQQHCTTLKRLIIYDLVCF